jgi:hypothetical protein
VSTKIVHAIYIGRRQGKGCTLYTFLYGKKEVYFGRTSGVVIGETYEMTSEGDGLKIATWPKRVDDAKGSPADLVGEWEARDLLVQRTLDEKQAYKNLKKTSAKLKAVAELLYPMVKNLGWIERRKLVEMLVNNIVKKGPVKLR